VTCGGCRYYRLETDRMSWWRHVCDREPVPIIRKRNDRSWAVRGMHGAPNACALYEPLPQKGDSNE
jgi:hypothetical protein